MRNSRIMFQIMNIYWWAGSAGRNNLKSAPSSSARTTDSTYKISQGYGKTSSPRVKPMLEGVLGEVRGRKALTSWLKG
ncbi:hypothetical protein WG66_011432, partial [Moniliophthora roreri]